jgi:hypothetical protein
MSSIRSDLETYTTAAEKLKEMRKTMKELTEVKNGAEKRIKEFLKSQEHPGVTFKGYKIYLDERKRTERERPIDAKKRALEILRSHGVENADEVMKELTAKSKIQVEVLRIA